MNASYSRMVNPRGGQYSLIAYRQIVTKFILHLSLCLTLLAYVGIICEINSLEQWVVTGSAPAGTVQCCLHQLPLFDIPRLGTMGWSWLCSLGASWHQQSHFRELQQAGGCTAGQLKPKNMGLFVLWDFSKRKKFPFYFKINILK